MVTPPSFNDSGIVHILLLSLCDDYDKNKEKNRPFVGDRSCTTHLKRLLILLEISFGLGMGHSRGAGPAANMLPAKEAPGVMI
jgi:hypothetical protein